MFQIREANKIDREYYVSKKDLEKFMDDMRRKTIYIWFSENKGIISNALFLQMLT